MEGICFLCMKNYLREGERLEEREAVTDWNVCADCHRIALCVFRVRWRAQYKLRRPNQLYRWLHRR